MERDRHTRIAAFLPGAMAWALLLIASAAPAPASDMDAARVQDLLKNNSCVNCHVNHEDDEARAPTQNIHMDVHIRKGLACHDCHGGDPGSDDEDVAMDPDRGWLSPPERSEIPEFCGRCPSDPEYMRVWNPGMPVDQVEKYWTSRHGQKLRMGDETVAICTDCHDVHNIRPSDDRKSTVHPINLPETCGACHADPKYMAGTGLPTNQLRLFRESVHGRALLEKGEIGSPSCNDCHGNHGAVPPDVSSLSRVCGLCHVQNLEYFLGSVHADAYAEEEIPECEACHGNHDIAKPDDTMLDVDGESICLDCHDEDDGTSGVETAAAMFATLTELAERHDLAEASLREVEIKGMPVTDALFDLSGARQHLIKARTRVHSFDEDEVLEDTRAGLELVESAEVAGASARERLRFRRNGLALSTLILTVLVIGLALKIRQIEAPQ